MQVLVKVSQENPSLAWAELETVLDADGLHWQPTIRMGPVHVGHLAHQGEPADPVRLYAAVSRLAMTQEVDVVRFTCPADLDALRQRAHTHPLHGPDSFAVRAERIGPRTETSPRQADIERTLGAAWSQIAPVDLDAPARTVRAYVHGDEVIVAERLFVHDASSYAARASRNRPFFSPVSGDPRWMRAIVNLAHARPGDTVYDPLCGTGGILIEAALAGHAAVGSDIDPKMVHGTQHNMDHYGVEGNVFEADVRDAVDAFRGATGRTHADALVTDLPYGQSASTRDQDPAAIAEWTLAAAESLLHPGARAVIGVPEPLWLANPPAGLQAESSFALRVHKSLTRTYVVFTRR